MRIKTQTNNCQGPTLIILAAVLWGTTGTSQALVPSEAQSQAINALRVVTGSAALILFSLLQGTLKSVKDLPLRPTFLTSLGLAGYHLFFFRAVSLAGVALGTMISLGSAPIFGESWVCLSIVKD
jgi:DME family drug/metabolite transporter